MRVVVGLWSGSVGCRDWFVVLIVVASAWWCSLWSAYLLSVFYGGVFICMLFFLFLRCG